MSFIISLPVAICQLSKVCYDRSLEVRRFRDDCRKLAQFIERIEGFIMEVEDEADTSEPGWQAAYLALHESLEDASALMLECAKYGRIRSLINSDDMAHRFNSVTQRLNLALSMLPLQKMKSNEIRMEALKGLQQDMRRAQYTALLLAEEHAADLKKLMDMAKHDSSKTHEMLEQVLGILSTNGKPDPQEVSAEMADLREELFRARALKNRVEEDYLCQIIQAVEAAGHHKDSAERENGGMTEAKPAHAGMPPSDLLCPITYQVFVDPVIVVESGQTYERASIEEWLARGHKKDPLTGTPLSSCMLVPNVVVRKLVADWLAKNPEYPQPMLPPPTPIRPPAVFVPAPAEDLKPKQAMEFALSPGSQPQAVPSPRISPAAGPGSTLAERMHSLSVKEEEEWQQPQAAEPSPTGNMQQQQQHSSFSAAAELCASSHEGPTTTPWARLAPAAAAPTVQQAAPQQATTAFPPVQHAPARQAPAAAAAPAPYSPHSSIHDEYNAYARAGPHMPEDDAPPGPLHSHSNASMQRTSLHVRPPGGSGPSGSMAMSPSGLARDPSMASSSSSIGRASVATSEGGDRLTLQDLQKPFALVRESRERMSELHISKKQREKDAERAQRFAGASAPSSASVAHSMDSFSSRGSGRDDMGPGASFVSNRDCGAGASFVSGRDGNGARSFESGRHEAAPPSRAHSEALAWDAAAPAAAAASGDGGRRYSAAHAHTFAEGMTGRPAAAGPDVRRVHSVAGSSSGYRGSHVSSSGHSHSSAHSRDDASSATGSSGDGSSSKASRGSIAKGMKSLFKSTKYMFAFDGDKL